jgi:hypothetical protein
MLFREITLDYCESKTKHISALKNAGFLSIKGDATYSNHFTLEG